MIFNSDGKMLTKFYIAKFINKGYPGECFIWYCASGKVHTLTPMSKKAILESFTLSPEKLIWV